MKDVHPVVISLNQQSKTYSPRFQTESEFAAGWQTALKRAYGNAELRCCCSGAGAKRLAVKYYEASGQFDLAKYAMSGGQHAPNCQYYSGDFAQSGQGSYSTGVIEDLGTGAVKIRLEVGLVERNAPEGAKPGDVDGERAPRARQSSMKLLGLLHYLWEESGLNSWKPWFAGKRTSSVVYGKVAGSADSVQVGGVDLVDHLLLPAFDARGPGAARNQARAAVALQAGHRMLLIAPLASYTAERDVEMSRQLKIGGFHGMPLVYTHSGLWQSVQRRFPQAVAAWRDGAITIAIVQLELKQGEKRVLATAMGMALMSVTAVYIPVESSYERRVADLLVEQGRAFRKPLRYDSGTEQVLPDFVLTDTGQETPLEVFGREDAAYLRRKEEKTAYYDEQYGPGAWWSWDASGGSSAALVPPFPKRG